MKKVFVATACVVLAIAVIGCAKKAKEKVKEEEKTEVMETGDEVLESTELEESVNEVNQHEYPQIVYIDNVLYYGTGEECQIVPRKAPDGTIETFCAIEIMPDAPNSANFGEENEKMEYMFLDDGELIVHNGEKWFFFDKENVK